MDQCRPPSKRSLPLLAMGSLGAQSVWSTEMAFASPFLLHLGMSKSKMAFVLIAGPLSGLLCQPIVGIITDNSTNRWGRRRPALVLACLLCVLSLLLLGFARPLAGLLVTDDASQKTLAIAFVVFSIFSIDFSLNAVNALDRALILDLVESKYQSLANVWSARLSGIGGIIGFFIGQNDLTNMIPKTKRSLTTNDQQIDSTEAQLRYVCILVSFLLIITHVVTIMVAKEQPAFSVHSINPPPRHRSLWRTLLSSIRMTWMGLSSTAKSLSRPVLEVFRVHFFLSMAWYPLLFYSTSWVGDIALSNSPSMDPVDSMRLGSLGMLCHASVSLLGTLFFPPLLQQYNRHHPHRSIDSLTALWSLSNLTLGFILLSTWAAEALSSTRLAVTIIALTGFAWALTTWAPYALLGILIQKGVEAEILAGGSDLSSGIDSGRSGYLRRASDVGAREEGAPLMHRSSASADKEDDEEDSDCSDIEDRQSSHIRVESAVETRNVDDRQGRVRDQRKKLSQNQSGAIQGLHNVTVVMPQFIMTATSSILFGILDKQREEYPSQPNTDFVMTDQRAGSNFGLILRLGGLSALTSSYFAFQLARKHSAALEG